MMKPMKDKIINILKEKAKASMAGKEDLCDVVDEYQFESIAEEIIELIEYKLRIRVWDSFLIAERQDEQWSDEDTCILIVRKIIEDEPIQLAKGYIP